MADPAKLTIWSREPVPGLLREVAAAVESNGNSTSFHVGAGAPEEPADVVLMWADSDAPAEEDRARELLRAEIAQVVLLAAPGAGGVAPAGLGDDAPGVMKIDPAWGSRALATTVEAAFACARACLGRRREKARLEDLAGSHESFVAIASHDLRTPVSTLRLLHDLFRSNLNARSEKLTPRELSEFDELLDIMARSLDKMDVFIGDILEAWRLYRGLPEVERERVALNAVVEDIVAGLFPSAMAKDIALDLVTDPSLAPITAEPGRAGQVVANLVENAVKYTPRGGAVTVYTRPSPEADGAILEVRDTGPGVPAGEREKLFRRFGRGSARATGGEPSTGLGLFICREIVERHGGRIWFEPAEGQGQGQGSRFFVLWPRGETPSRGGDG